MLTKEKRAKLIGSLLTLTMTTTLISGCSNEEEQASEEWNNDNTAATQPASNYGFWDMVTAFGLGYALSHMFRGSSVPPVPPKQPPAYTDSAKPGADAQSKAAQPGSTVTQGKAQTAPSSPKVSSPSGGKTGIGSSSIRSHAVS